MVTALLLALGGCAKATNYMDPSGPRFSGVVASPYPAMTQDLRVVTYNVQWGKDVPGAIRLLQSEPAVRNADILLLQEMEENGVAAVAEALDMSWVYYPSAVHPQAGQNFGNAILTRWTLVDDRKLILPRPSKGNDTRRSAVIATLEVGGARIRVYAVHLATVIAVGGAGQEEQMRAIVEDAASSPDPVIVAGDLNSDTIGRMMVAEGYRWITREVGTTTRIFSVDHIFLKGWPNYTTATAGALAVADPPSDHRPVWTVIQRAGPIVTGGSPPL
jgi:endonuclease/exonuclease/phosphatase family metal-dependent hydrolase